MQEVKFENRLHTNRACQPMVYGFIDTVSRALEVFASLLHQDRGRPHRQRAKITLRQAVECPDDATLLKFAKVIFGKPWQRRAG